MPHRHRLASDERRTYATMARRCRWMRWWRRLASPTLTSPSLTTAPATTGRSARSENGRRMLRTSCMMHVIIAFVWAAARLLALWGACARRLKRGRQMQEVRDPPPQSPPSPSSLQHRRHPHHHRHHHRIGSHRITTRWLLVWSFASGLHLGCGGGDLPPALPQPRLVRLRSGASHASPRNASIFIKNFK